MKDVMKNDKIRFLLCFLFFVALAFITFRCAWGDGKIFATSDINIGRLAAMKLRLPEHFTGSFSGNQLFGSMGFGISLFAVFLWLLPLEAAGDLFYGLVLVLGSMSLVAYLRLWNRSWGACLVGALVAFWFNSILLAPTGHAFKMEVLAFSVFSLYWIERAVREESFGRLVGFAMLAGVSVGIMLLEQQDVAIFAGLFIGPYAVLRLIQTKGRAWKRWVGLLGPIGVVALLLAGASSMEAYRRNIQDAAPVQSQGDSAKWDFITQWSMVPDEWPDLVAPGWGGWGSHNPEGPYWGRIGRSAEWEETGRGFRNFKLATTYFGLFPFVFTVFSGVMAWRQRKQSASVVVLFWAGAALVGLLLACGRYSFLYRIFYQLPLVNNIRAPIKFLDNVQIAVGIVAAYGIDQALYAIDRKGLRRLWIVFLGCGMAMLMAGLYYRWMPENQLVVFREEGFGEYAASMVDNMSAAWVHAAVGAFLVAGLLAANGWRGIRAGWVVGGVVTVLTFDSLLLTSRYFRAEDMASIEQANPVIRYIRDHQGDERAYFVDTNGIYNQWLASDGPYHDLSLFNVWQLPRMPQDYKEFLAVVGADPIRLWQLSSVRLVAAPVSVMRQFSRTPALEQAFQPALNYQVPTPQGLRSDVLMEFTSTIPRCALFSGWTVVDRENQCRSLVSPQHDVMRSVLVDAAAGLTSKPAQGRFQKVAAHITKKRARMMVQSDQGGVLRFSQYFQPGWSVRIDGNPADLLRVDYLCMGVMVPAGEHEVEFRCLNATATAVFVFGGFLVSLGSAIVLLRIGRKKKA